VARRGGASTEARARGAAPGPARTAKSFLGLWRSIRGAAAKNRTSSLPPERRLFRPDRSLARSCPIRAPADPRFPRTRLFRESQVGMRHFHKQKNHYHCPIINLDKLWTLVGEEKRLECAAASGQAPVIDLTDYGIFKCLGKGQLPKQPVVVKARYISKLAEKKIKEVGGACILTA
jgi:hypothetical protein